MTIIPARLLAWAERLVAYRGSSHVGPEHRCTLCSVVAELREAGGEDANDPVLAERARIVAHLRARADKIGSELHNWHAFVLREEANNIESGTDEQTTPEQYEEKTDVYAEAAGEDAREALGSEPALSSVPADAPRCGYCGHIQGSHKSVLGDCVACTLEKTAPCSQYVPPAPAEPELWGVWCEPLEVNVPGWYRHPNGRRLESSLKPLMLGLDQLPGWRYEARPLPGTK
jgi:hypothetical protein